MTPLLPPLVLRTENGFFALELGRAVEVEYRDPVFFGPHRVTVSVRLA